MKQKNPIFLLALAVMFLAFSMNEIRLIFFTSLFASEVSHSVVSTTSSSSWKSFDPNPQDLDYCSNNNFVLDREQRTAIEQNENNAQPFSIDASDFLPHHNRTCSSVHDTINAIRNGTRRWEEKYENLSLVEREGIHSNFVPRDCDIPLYSPRRICEVLNRFSHVVIQGDSRSRHLQGGLLMALRNDLIQGALVQPSPNPDYSKCRCDSQFSEHIACRIHGELYRRFRPRQLSLCPELDEDDQFESVFSENADNLKEVGVYKFDGVNCTSGKGILVIVQGGIHLRYQASPTYLLILKQFLTNPIFRSCAEQGKAYLMWTSYQPQSPSYDKKYPWQGLNKGIPFNVEMTRMIQQDKIQNLTTMDWLNFLTGTQHTDGVHYAAHANYFKAQHIVAVADLMWKEGMTVSY
jgi:hypothetical protein